MVGEQPLEAASSSGRSRICLLKQFEGLLFLEGGQRKSPLDSPGATNVCEPVLLERRNNPLLHLTNCAHRRTESSQRSRMFHHAAAQKGERGHKFVFFSSYFCSANNAPGRGVTVSETLKSGGDKEDEEGAGRQS